MASYCMIVGAMKAGTSTLFDFLAQQDGINASRVKEPEYFSRSQPHSLNIANYEDLYATDLPQEWLRLEASTGYSKPGEEEAAARIAQFTPNPRLIFIARDPLSRIESHYNFVDGIRRKAGTRDPLEAKFIDSTRYNKMLAPFLDAFGRDAILVLRFEDLFARENSTSIAAIAAHLDLELPKGPVSFTKKNSREGLHSLPVRWVLRRVPARLRNAAPKTLLRPVVRGISRLTNKEKPYRRLSQTECDKACALLADDLQAFSETYGVSLDGWRGFTRDAA